MNSLKALLPCPFCGKDPETKLRETFGWVVECDCTHFENTEAGAISSWNARAGWQHALNDLEQKLPEPMPPRIFEDFVFGRFGSLWSSNREQKCIEIIDKYTELWNWAKNTINEKEHLLALEKIDVTFEVMGKKDE